MKHQPFYVIEQDFNSREFKGYDIMPYLINVWNEIKQKSKPASKQDIREWLDNTARYLFWSKCEWEVVLCGWPNTDNTKKIDVYWQIKMNFDLIVDIFCKNVGVK